VTEPTAQVPVSLIREAAEWIVELDHRTARDISDKLNAIADAARPMPNPPTRERIAEAIAEGRRDRNDNPTAARWPKMLSYVRKEYLADADVVLTLLRNGADRRATACTEPCTMWSVEHERTPLNSTGTRSLRAPSRTTGCRQRPSWRPTVAESFLPNAHTNADPKNSTGTAFVRGYGTVCAECGWLLRSIYPIYHGDDWGQVGTSERQHAERYPPIRNGSDR